MQTARTSSSFSMPGRHVAPVRRLPMLARIKMLQIMGYLSVMPPRSSRCHSNVSGVMREQAFSLSRVCYPPNVTSEVRGASMQSRTNVRMRRLHLPLLHTVITTFPFPVAHLSIDFLPNHARFTRNFSQKFFISSRRDCSLKKT